MNINDYRNAPQGVGPMAGEWKDKPHRLVYDLCAEVALMRVEVDKLAGAIEKILFTLQEDDSPDVCNARSVLNEYHM